LARETTLLLFLNFFPETGIARKLIQEPTPAHPFTPHEIVYKEDQPGRVARQFKSSNQATGFFWLGEIEIQ
jgi:hypothetical protein